MHLPFHSFIVYWMMLWWVGWLGVLSFRIFAAFGRKMSRAQYLTYAWLLIRYAHAFTNV